MQHIREHFRYSRAELVEKEKYIRFSCNAFLHHIKLNTCLFDIKSKTVRRTFKYFGEEEWRAREKDFILSGWR